MIGIGALRFFARCNPPRTTKQARTRTAVKGAFARTYVDAVGKALEADLREILRPYVPAQPFSVPVACVIDVVWVWNTGDLKRDRALGQVPHGTIPDADNYAKQVLDCMTRLGFWSDDGLVADLRITKRRSHVAGIGVAVAPIVAACWPAETVEIATHGVGSVGEMPLFGGSEVAL